MSETRTPYTVAAVPSADVLRCWQKQLEIADGIIRAVRNEVKPLMTDDRMHQLSAHILLNDAARRYLTGLIKAQEAT